jgi:uncharacterized protein (TIGR02246 family)
VNLFPSSRAGSLQSAAKLLHRLVCDSTEGCFEMMPRFAVLIAVLLAAPALFAQSAPNTSPTKGGAEDEKAIRAVLDRFVDAWNKHDAKAFAAVFAEDADFTNVAGTSARGRGAIEEFHAAKFATIFKDSIQSIVAVRIRFVRPDVAAVEMEWKMTGAASPDGRQIPVRHGLLNFTMTRDAGAWQILVMHNMNLPAP